MPQPRHRFRLAPKPVPHRRLGAQLGTEQLVGDVALEERVGRSVDDREIPAAKLLSQFVLVAERALEARRGRHPEDRERPWRAGRS